MLLVLLVGGISYGAYYIGRKTASSVVQPGAASTTAAPTETVPQSSPSATPARSDKPSKTVKAGLDASSGLSFTKYQMTVPEDWTVSHTTTSEGTWIDTLTLTKGTTQLKIFQAATGGAMCLYPGDPEFEGPSSTYDAFVDITTADGVILRRGSTNVNNGTTKGYTMCQKGTETFGQPTVFGHMSLTTSLNPDKDLLTEVDAMIASLKKL